MTIEIHPCEPSLEELKKIQKREFTRDSTDSNVKRLKAIEVQIHRHEKAAAEKKAAGKVSQETKDATEKLAAAAEKKAKENEERQKASDLERRKHWHSRPRGGMIEPQRKE